MERTTAPSPTGGGLFYGWYVVGAVFVVLAVSAGLCFYNLSVYLRAFVAEREFSVAQTSIATAAFFVSGGIGGLVAGHLIDRYDPRWIIAISAVLAAATLAGAGLVAELWQLYAFYVLFGFAYAGCGLVPGTTLVARWFNRRRSVALAYASTGLSIGGIVLTPLSAYLIEDMGIGPASQWLAVIFILSVVPVSLWLIRPSPESMGLTLDGDPPVGPSADAATDGVPFAWAVRSRFFLFCTAAYVFAMMAQVGSIAHQYSLVAGRTGNPDTAALAVATMAGASIVGRLIGGWALAWLPSKPFVLALAAVQAVALALYGSVQTEAALLGMAALFGATVGNLLMMQPLLIAEAFGLHSYGRIFSVGQMVTTLGVAAGPAVMGLVHQAAGGYPAAYLVAASASVAAFAILSLAGPVGRPAAELAAEMAAEKAMESARADQ